MQRCCWGPLQRRPTRPPCELAPPQQSCQGLCWHAHQPCALLPLPPPPLLPPPLLLLPLLLPRLLRLQHAGLLSTPQSASS